MSSWTHQHASTCSVPDPEPGGTSTPCRLRLPPSQRWLCLNPTAQSSRDSYAAAHSQSAGTQSSTTGQHIRAAINDLRHSLDGRVRQFVPMATLFFLMAFINTILDNLKDTLIFTLAVGGGAHVIPWLTGVESTLRRYNMTLRYNLPALHCLVLLCTASYQPQLAAQHRQATSLPSADTVSQF